MKYVFFLFGVLIGINTLKAQDTAALVKNTNLSVQQDSSLSRLMSEYKAYNHLKDATDGYRIQVTYTDIRTEAYNSKGQMYKEFPELKSYVEYDQPYYKLRLGDFKTRLEATYYLQQVIILYPGAFIVKDKIIVR
ncbi:MAG: SPOR domain-containing protein [Chitinophagales bacterium]